MREIKRVHKDEYRIAKKFIVYTDLSPKQMQYSEDQGNGMKIKEIARKHNVAEQTIKNTLVEAHRKLRLSRLLRVRKRLGLD